MERRINFDYPVLDLVQGVTIRTILTNNPFRGSSDAIKRRVLASEDILKQFSRFLEAKIMIRLETEIGACCRSERANMGLSSVRLWNVRSLRLNNSI